MKAEILTIGDEILRGEIIDSNKARLAEALLSLDIETHYHATVRDDPADLSDAFRRAFSRSQIILVSGGLGPTRDDLTIQVLADTLGRPLVRHVASLETIRGFFTRLGRDMSPNNEKQADFPEGAEVLPNPLGTAPGCMVEENGALLFCMPGVPSELERMLQEEVLPRIRKRRGGGYVVRATLLRTFGMGESTLDNVLGDLDFEGEVSLGFRTSFPDNYLRPLARAETVEAADQMLAAACAAIRERLGPLVYGEGDETLEQVVGQLLRQQGRSVAVAESCTGGLIAERLSSIPGASEYLLGGVVAYANSAKQQLIDVPAALLESEGAVSQAVALAMAQGVRKRFSADIALATTGISGPGGGSEAKPVGLVYLALATESFAHAEGFVFPLDRIRHRSLTSQLVLDWLRRHLLGVELVSPSMLKRRV